MIHYFLSCGQMSHFFSLPSPDQLFLSTLCVCALGIEWNGNRRTKIAKKKEKNKERIFAADGAGRGKEDKQTNIQTDSSSPLPSLPSWRSLPPTRRQSQHLGTNNYSRRSIYVR